MIDNTGNGPVNAMSVDVEEWFQVSAFERQIRREDWPNLQSRVHANTSRILELFAAHQVKATFFCLGWIAERHPQLLRQIVAEGHELASHGYSHVRATEQSPVDFTADVSRTKALLEDLSGIAVRGYRAASFSIGRNNLWALDCLQEADYVYSSSIFPVHHVDGYEHCARTGCAEHCGDGLNAFVEPYRNPVATGETERAESLSGLLHAGFKRFVVHQLLGADAQCRPGTIALGATPK